MKSALGNRESVYTRFLAIFKKCSLNLYMDIFYVQCTFLLLIKLVVSIYTGSLDNVPVCFHTSYRRHMGVYNLFIYFSFFFRKKNKKNIYFLKITMNLKVFM